jgi:hypothetical protein
MPTLLLALASSFTPDLSGAVNWLTLTLRMRPYTPARLNTTEVGENTLLMIPDVETCP